MKRFLSTTAVIVALTGGAYAETHAGQMGMVEFEQSDFYASDLIGMRIYNAENGVAEDGMMTAGAEQEWDDIGEINDIIIGENGEVRAVILGVGGFLGMGERDVSVSMDDIRILNEEGGDRFLVVSTSQEALEAAPEFDRGMDDMERTNTETDAQVNDTAVTATDGTTPLATTATEEADSEMAETDMTNENMAGDDNVTVVTTTNEPDDADANAVNTDSTLSANNEQAEPMMNDSALMRPTYQREGYMDAEPADREKLTAEVINGAYVYGANDETVGEIDDIVMSEDGKATDVVINVGGFLGLGEKPVLVNFDQIQVLRSADGSDYRFYIDSTEEKLEALPEYQQ